MTIFVTGAAGLLGGALVAALTKAGHAVVGLVIHCAVLVKFEAAAAKGKCVTAKSGIAERLVKPYLGYFQRNPEFETRALAQLSGREAPDMDEAALIRQIRYCLAAGFIRTNKIPVAQRMSG